MKLSFGLILLTLMSSPPSFAKRQPISDEEPKISVPFKEAETGTELRKIRRFGVGGQVSGSLGIGGFLMDLNFTPYWSFGIGYGGGTGFQAVHVQAKYVLAGDWLMPYMSFGYARWASSSKNGKVTKTTPALLADKLLSHDEKTSGEYQKNLLYPGFGLQFLQLKGNWAGSSIYGEIIVLMDIESLVAAPTGAIGFLYYF